MTLEKIFVFLLIFFSLIGGVFLIKKEIAVLRGQSQLALSLQQKIGQIFIIGIEGKTITPETKQLIRNFYPGGVLLLKKNIESKEQVKKLIADLQEISLQASGLPLFIAVDQEGGLISRLDFLPEKTPQSKIETVEQAFQVGLTRGQELRELGINLNLAPVLDTAEPGDFLYERTFQKEAVDTAELAKALIAGQREAGILTCVKHFPGYAGIAFNPEEKLAIVPKIPETSQFREVIPAQPEMAMTSNVIYQEINNGFPFTFSSTSIQFLKENLGEKPLIISDDLSQNSLLNKFSLEDIVGLPIKAGVDALIFSGWRSPVAPAISALQKTVETGQISEQTINQAVLRIIELKKAYAMLK